MKRTILIGFEFTIFILLLCAVIIYAQVIFQKYTTSFEPEHMVEVEQEPLQEQVKETLSVEKKYKLLEDIQKITPASTSVTIEDKRQHLRSSYNNATGTKTQLTVQEKMKLLEQ